jgi:hypothetical protein
MASRLHNSGLSEQFFDFVILDEAGKTNEIETLGIL